MSAAVVPGSAPSLEAWLDRVDRAQAEVAGRLAEDPALAGTYADLVRRLRELCLADPRAGEPSPRPFAKAVRAAAGEARRCLALLGPRDGLARGVMKHLALLDLAPEDRLLAALGCAREDAEQTLAHLAEAALGEEPALRVVLVAMGRQPVLDFTEYKTLETVHLGMEPEAPEARETQRRFEQARSRRHQHARRHLIGQVAAALRQRPEAWRAILDASLARDPFGTLDHFRAAAAADPFAGLGVEQRLDLLDRVAGFGLGLASVYLDLFAIPPEPAWIPRLQEVLRRDITAGSTILGVHALEGAQNYPFGLERIEPVLPRRVTAAAALAHLRKGEPESAKPRTFTSVEVGEVSDRLQQLEVQRFLEVLRSDLAQRWRACVGDRKRDILFADPQLRIREVLFLLAHALFEPEETFETLHSHVRKSHPMFASDANRILVLANRFYFLDLLGLNPGLLFIRGPRASGGARSFIEEAGDYPVRALLHAGMAIHLRVGAQLIRSLAIAWSILVGQSEGRVDPVLQEVAALLEGLDTLFAVAGARKEDLRDWQGPLLDALQADAEDLPEADAAGPIHAPLRLTTRTVIEAYRLRVNQYCVQALRREARAAGVSPVNVVQGLRLPRARTDKLLALLGRS